MFSFAFTVLSFLSLVVMFTDPVKLLNEPDKIAEARHFFFSMPMSCFSTLIMHQNVKTSSESETWE